MTKHYLPIKQQHGEIVPLGPAETHLGTARSRLLESILADLAEANKSGENIAWALPFALSMAAGAQKTAWEIANANGAYQTDFDYTLEILEIEVA